MMRDFVLGRQTTERQSVSCSREGKLLEAMHRIDEINLGVRWSRRCKFVFIER